MQALQQEILPNALDSHPEKIYARVKINEHHSLSLKIDTGADSSVINTAGLQVFPSPITILPCKIVLRGYGGSDIENIGAAS